ncbi:AI-2E family transporter [soil metagenome]
MSRRRGAVQVKFGKFIGLILFVGLLYLLWQIRQVLLLVFAAVVFATVINKPVQWLQKLGINRGLAVALSLFTITCILLGAVWFVVPALVERLPQYTFFSEQGINKLQTWYQQIKGILPGDALADTPLSELLPQVTQFSPNWIGRVMAVFTSSLDFFLNALLVLVTIIMLLANPQSYRRIFILAFPKFYRARANKITTECESALTGWVSGILFNMTVVTLFSGIGLAILGVPLPTVNAVIAGLLTFIPNIGPFLSVIPPALMALAIKPWLALAVVLLYVAIQQLEGNVLTQIVMKKQVSLLPAITLMAQVISAVFFGFLGLFLALPLVVVLQVWAKELLVKDILDRWRAPKREIRPLAINPQEHKLRHPG